MVQAVATAEFSFTKNDFRCLAGLVRAETGIVLPETKAALVYSRLSRRLRSLGLTRFSDYCALLAGGDDAERDALIAAITTNVTSFFREPHHFDHLREKVLPALIARARAGGRVRLWSAACSSGEEAWSVALTVLAVMPDAPDHDVLVLASDVDPDVLARAKTGRYPIAALEAIPASLQGMVARSGRDFGFHDAARALLRFRRLNLAGEWPVRGLFDVIFCRNVMIYFDAPGQARVWAGFASRMSAGAHLYIGHSERIASPDFTLAGQTTYRRVAP